MNAGAIRIPQLLLLALLVCGLDAAQALSPIVPTLTLSALCIWLWKSNSAALQASALAVLIKFLNPAAVAFRPEVNVLLSLLVALAGIRVFVTTRFRGMSTAWPIILFVIFSVVAALFVSPRPTISITKAVLFAWSTLFILVGSRSLSAAELRSLREWLLALGLGSAVMALCTLSLPHIAYARNGTGLQGFFNHPQALAIFIAPFVAWALVSAFRYRSDYFLIHIGLAVAGGGVLALTEARTAAFAVVGAMFLGLVTGFLSSQRKREFGVSRSLVLALLAAISLLGIRLAGGSISDLIAAFVDKRSETSSLSETFMASRGGGVQSQLGAFAQKPLFGNGFGVYPDGEFPSGVTYLAGIPISAPVEKGFLPTATLEESGLVGMALLIAIIVVLTRQSLDRSDPESIALFSACLLVNIGEACFFSPGSEALYFWIIIGSCRPLVNRDLPTRPTAPQLRPNFI